MMCVYFIPRISKIALIAGFTRVRNSSLQLDTEEGSIKLCRAFSPNRLSRYRRMQLAQRGNLCDESKIFAFFEASSVADFMPSDVYGI